MEMKVRIFIRADGSSEIGVGHLVRCLALAQMLKSDFEISFYFKEIPDTLFHEFIDNNLHCEKIASEEEFISMLSNMTIAVLDGYQFGSEYQKQIKIKGSKLVCIDDLHEGEFLADLIINHSPGIKPQDYIAKPSTLFALGTDYALLRPAFLEQSKKRRKIQEIKTLLISFGGADPDGLTERVLKIALDFNELRKIIVVTGAMFKESDNFKRLLLGDQRVEHRQNLGEKKMLDAMLEAELVIVPASIVLFESLAAGCIVISGHYVNNQSLVYKNFKNSRVFIDAANFKPEKLKQAIRIGLNENSSITNPITGESKDRLIKLFQILQNDNEISLRLAEKSDLEITFKWAANPEVRQYSFQKHQITLKEHTPWFLRKIKDPDCKFFIGEIKGLPIGSIRFDINNGEALISYLIDPEYQGKSLGQVLLKRGLELLIKETDFQGYILRSIIGLVMKPNIPSIKAFERMGFERIDLGDEYKFVKTL